MKYIKKFEAVDSNWKEKFKTLCDNYLAYLKDDGFNIDYIDSIGDFVRVTIDNFGQGNSPYAFKWDDIKDYLLPVLEIIENKFNLHGDISFHSSVNVDGIIRSNFVDYPMYILTSEEINENDIRLIIFTVKEY